MIATYVATLFWKRLQYLSEQLKVHIASVNIGKVLYCILTLSKIITLYVSVSVCQLLYFEKEKKEMLAGDGTQYQATPGPKPGE